MGPTTTHAGSNGSSVGSGLDEKDSSYISSVDEYLLDNHASSSSIYTKDESARFISSHHLRRESLPDELIDHISPAEAVTCTRDRSKPNENSNPAKDEVKSNATANGTKMVVNGNPLPNGMFRRGALVADIHVENARLRENFHTFKG